MRTGPDPLPELAQLLARSRQLLGELRVIEGRLEDVARRISNLPLRETAPIEVPIASESNHRKVP